MAIFWTERLSIDKGLIDDDHKVLIELSNTFLNLKKSADKVALAKVLSDLEHYARIHFWREGQLQAKIGYCYAEQQAEEHKQLVATLGMIVIRFFQATAPAELERIATEIGELIQSWLVDHILQSDIHMAAYRAEIQALSQNMGRIKDNASQENRTIGSEFLYNLHIDDGIIDEDHQYLVETINSFIIGTSENVPLDYLQTTLATLDKYTTSHFQREEDLQKAVKYPDYKAHHQAHQSLMDKLHGFQDMLANITDTQALRVDLCQMLRDWIINHIGEQDAAMRPYVQKMREAALQLRTLKA